MSWASNRTTTREEDTAYCLMGTFDINMPMLYGEGMKAFIRLREEIIRISHDQTILAWWSKPSLYGSHDGGLLANSPHLFAKSSNVASSDFEVGRESGIGFRFCWELFRATTANAPLKSWKNFNPSGRLIARYSSGTCLALIGCMKPDEHTLPGSQVALCLCPTVDKQKSFQRVKTEDFCYIKADQIAVAEMTSFLAKKMARYRWDGKEKRRFNQDLYIRATDFRTPPLKFSSIEGYPLKPPFLSGSFSLGSNLIPTRALQIL
jgi:hypothetical protein